MTIQKATFGWYQIEDVFPRDSLRMARITKLQSSAVYLDGYSLMCVSFAKAPLARETLLELCLHLGETIGCAEELLTLPRTTAFEIFQHVVPFLKSKVTEEASYSIRASLCTLQYTAAVGAIFNDFFMDRTVKITRENIQFYEDQMKDVLKFYDAWQEEVGSAKENSDQFISGITYQILQSSIRGFFEYCRLAFEMDSSQQFVMIMQSNSSSIEAVFANIRNMKRDTPQGFVTAASVSSSSDGISLLSTRCKKKSYDGNDIPDICSPTKDILNRRDKEREYHFGSWLSSRNERKAIVALENPKMQATSLSEGYNKLMRHVEEQIALQVGAKGFLSFLVNLDDFTGTMKCSVFTESQVWFETLLNLQSEEEEKFNKFCLQVLSFLYSELDSVSKQSRRGINGSYQRKVYTFLADKDCAVWKELKTMIPLALQSPQASSEIPLSLIVSSCF